MYPYEGNDGTSADVLSMPRGIYDLQEIRPIKIKPRARNLLAVGENIYNCSNIRICFVSLLATPV